MVTKAELYMDVLRELEKCNGDIRSTAIVTPDGLIMTATSSGGVDRETFAAYSAATFRHAGNAMGEISNENIDMLLFESRNYRVITIHVTDYALLIALTGKNAPMETVLSWMQESSRKIKEL